MKLGIVGLPNVGKSTLFNALTKIGAEASNYPFCTIEPNTGIVPVVNERLNVLSDMYNSEKIIPAIIEFVDIAGLVKGASTGEGLGNKFLSHIREVDAIVHVVRCFEDQNVIHVEGQMNPIRDIDDINLELMLSDLETVKKRIERVSKIAKSNNKDAIIELNLLNNIREKLEKFESINIIELEHEMLKLVDSFNLITTKPVIYLANLSEEDIFYPAQNKYFNIVKEYANSNNSEFIAISAKMESEIAQLSDPEKEEFLRELNLEKSGLEKLIQVGYKQLNLISYLTAGPKEVRAWTITNGTKAPQAAGKIHSDFERGFIRAEIVAYDDLIKAGSMGKAKEQGLVRSEGKEYVIKPNDVILFRFNV